MADPEGAGSLDLPGLFVRSDSLHLSQQHSSGAGEAETHNPLVWSQALYHRATALTSGCRFP